MLTLLLLSPILCMPRFIVQADVTAQIAPTTVLLIALQTGFQSAKDMLKQRRACQDPRSSMGWPMEKEEAWNKALECCRSGVVYWVGASTLRQEVATTKDPLL
jgi:hypothetical protein